MGENNVSELESIKRKLITWKRTADQELKEFSDQPSPAPLEAAFPSIAKWVQSYGHIAIGDQDGFGFIVRAIDDGGLVLEDDKPPTLAEAMVALEDRLTQRLEAAGTV
jgi:hypothetical protein